jgi:hypothetical protein
VTSRLTHSCLQLENSASDGVAAKNEIIENEKWRRRNHQAASGAAPLLHAAWRALLASMAGGIWRGGVSRKSENENQRNGIENGGE